MDIPQSGGLRKTCCCPTGRGLAKYLGLGVPTALVLRLSVLHGADGAVGDGAEEAAHRRPPGRPEGKIDGMDYYGWCRTPPPPPPPPAHTHTRRSSTVLVVALKCA